MSSDPHLGTVFLLALTMPEEKAIKKPQSHLIIFSRQPTCIQTTGNPPAGQFPWILMVLVGSCSPAAPQGCSGQALCACGSQLCFVQRGQRQMFNLLPLCQSEPRAMTIKHWLGGSQRWRCNSSLISLAQRRYSCWCRFMGCVRQFSLATVRKEL